MYQKYYTESLVLSHCERGEADRVFTLYTREFGLVRARASAVRTEDSRMRYALQTGFRAHCALIRGKRGWRAAGAAPLAHLTAQGSVVFARLARLLERLIAGEDKNEYLYSALVEAHAALARGTAERFPAIELICVARVLHALGYLPSESVSAALLTAVPYGEEHFAEAEKKRERILASINQALAAAQL